MFTGACFLVACSFGAAPAKKKKRAPVDPGDDFYDDEVPTVEQPLEPDDVNPNSGAFGPAGERPKPPTVKSSDAGTIDSDGGTGPKMYCGPTLAAGDLAVVELMISSKAGSGDSGEWAEIQNTRTCWLKLQGVSVESPRGAAAANVATITDDFELGPHGTFVVADSVDPLKNHGIPGKVIAWNATDVLKNDGDTVIVKIGAVEIDKLTYPAFSNIEPGRALSFPGDCAWTDRSSWARWSLTFDEYGTAFKGTPNAENTDVACF